MLNNQTSPLQGDPSNDHLIQSDPTFFRLRHYFLCCCIIFLSIYSFQPTHLDISRYA